MSLPFRRFSLPTRLLAIPIAALAVMGVVAVPAVRALRSDITLTGFTDGALVGRPALAQLQARAVAHGTSAHRITGALDGRRISGHVDGHAMVFDLSAARDGRHTFTVRLAKPYSLGSERISRAFVVDTVPPGLTAPATVTDDSPSSPITVGGTVEQGATLTANGRVVPVTGGRFSAVIPAPAPAAVQLVAKDLAGNVTTRSVVVLVTHPFMRAVHVTALAWTADVLRNPVIALARSHRINTIELDIKDEDGVIGFPSTLKIARQIGASSHIYDARKVVAYLHKLHIRLVGRLVCFRDPKLAQWAWTHGHRDMVIQDRATGQPWAGRYGQYSFTNFANPIVRQYNIELAAEAARLGFDDVLFDYVRRPDGPPARLLYPGLHVDPQVSVATFVKPAYGPVRAAGAYLGASVFGVSSTRPSEVAQNIPMIAKYVDYVAPMVYPSHWANGEYGVANPNAQPYAIVFRSLKDFVRDVRGTRAQVIPWLQDFSLGVHYGPGEVKAQVLAAARDGVQSFLFWNAGTVYQTSQVVPVLAHKYWNGV